MIYKLFGRSLTLALLGSMIALHLEGGPIMARGGPDGELQPYGFATHEVDPGSIYQYLWGWSPIDSKGRVFYLDTFNNGLTGGWRLSATGAAAVPSLINGGSNPGLIYSPPYAVQLNQGVTLNDRSFMFREMFMGTTTRLGFEAAVRIENTSPEIRVQFDYRPVGATGGLSILRYLSGSWYVWTSSGWKAFYTPGVPPVNTSMFVQVKFVGDYAAKKYVRALIGDQSFDLSTYTMDTSASTYTGLLIATILGVSTGAGGATPKVGYVLLTKDEP